MWDTARDRLALRVFGHTNWVRSATFPSKSTLVTTGADLTLRVWSFGDVLSQPEEEFWAEDYADLPATDIGL